jgi:hypothetical protein
MKLLWVKASLLIIIGLMLGLISMGLLRSDPISSVSGLAVAQAPLIWNNVKDGAAGDNLINGLLASGLYGYDAVGGNWDRVRIDPAGNLNVNIGASSIGFPTQSLATLLAAVAVPTTGATLDTTFLLSKHTWEIVVTGGPANETTLLEGSINGATWYTLDTCNITTSEMRHVVNKPVRYVRGNCTVLPSGTVTVRYMGGGN